MRKPVDLPSELCYEPAESTDPLSRELEEMEVEEIKMADTTNDWRDGATRRLAIRCCGLLCNRLFLLLLGVLCFFITMVRSFIPREFGSSHHGQKFINGVIDMVSGIEDQGRYLNVSN